MKRPTHIAAPVAAILANVATPTIGRWIARGYFGACEPRPGCAQRYRQIEVRRLEELLGHSYSAAQVATALERHVADIEESRLNKATARRTENV